MGKVSCDDLETMSAATVVWSAIFELKSAASHAERKPWSDEGREERDRDVLRYINKALGMLETINTRMIE